MHTTSVSLLERLRRPDAGAEWTRFVNLYTPLLHSWARHMGLQGQDMSDLVQEVFLLLLRKLPEFRYDDRQGSFRSWLRTVAINKWRELQRKRQPLAMQPDTLSDMLPPQDSDDFWDKEYRQQLLHQTLQVVRDDFQPTTWQAFWEFVVQGRPGTEVAQELGLSLGAVYAAKVRVMARLREELTGLLD
jgi:RNA polymerase sigma-70 factor (ECF subfamily)